MFHAGIQEFLCNSKIWDFFDIKVLQHSLNSKGSVRLYLTFTQFQGELFKLSNRHLKHIFDTYVLSLCHTRSHKHCRNNELKTAIHPKPFWLKPRTRETPSRKAPMLKQVRGSNYLVLSPVVITVRFYFKRKGFHGGAPQAFWEEHM